MIEPIKYSADTKKQILNRSILDTSAVEQTVKEIIADVRGRGDNALREYTLKFDKTEVRELAVSQDEFD